MKRRMLVQSLFILGLVVAFMTAGCAPITVSSEPSGANVYLKETDTLIGPTPARVDLYLGSREVMVRKAGYFAKSVILSPVDPENVHVQLEPCDSVILLSKPDNADVYIIGQDKPIGRTPFELDYSLPDRTFELKADGYLPKIVDVPEDPEANITIGLEREPHVTIESRPKRVNIYGDGVLLGMTPLQVKATEEVRLEARKDGYYSKEFAVDLETEGGFTIELEREPIIIVYSEPEDAIVYQRGVVVGRTPYRKLVDRETELEVTLERHYPKTIAVDEYSPRQIRVKLEEKPYITIDSEPTGAELYRIGGVELIGTTPAEVLIEEATALELQLRGFETKEFTLSPDSQRVVTVPLYRATGAGGTGAIIIVDSNPTGAKVYRPGGAELIGITPLEQNIRAEKTLELYLDGYKSKIVTIAPESAERVVYTMEKDGTAGDVIISDPLLNTPASF